MFKRSKFIVKIGIIWIILNSERKLYQISLLILNIIICTFVIYLNNYSIISLLLSLYFISLYIAQKHLQIQKKLQNELYFLPSIVWEKYYESSLLSKFMSKKETECVFNYLHPSTIEVSKINSHTILKHYYNLNKDPLKWEMLMFENVI